MRYDRGMPLIVRRATAADARALAALRFEFRAALAPARESKPAFLRRCARWMRTRLQGGQWHCWVALADGQIVASLWLCVIEKVPNPVREAEKHGYLTNFFVREPYRNRGLGARMLSAMLRWSRVQRLDIVFLWPSEQSRTLYVRHGAGDARDMLAFPIGRRESGRPA